MKQLNVAALKTLELDGDKLLDDAANAFIQGGAMASVERSLLEAFGHELLHQVELAAERQNSAAAPNPNPAAKAT